MGAVRDSPPPSSSLAVQELLPGMSPAKALSPPEAEASGRC